jgi:ribosomal protein S18 acetylase RimI-like enzyme
VRPPDPAAVRPLDPARDRQQLATFSCRDFRSPWTDVVEEMVREHLADSLACGAVGGLGAWDGQRLCGVAAFVIDDGTRVCHSQLLAVQMGYARRGYGQLLKRAIIDIARRAGAEAVLSTVHFDNDPIIELNRKLGASIERVPGDPEYLYCTIPLAPPEESGRPGT